MWPDQFPILVYNCLARLYALNLVNPHYFLMKQHRLQDRQRLQFQCLILLEAVANYFRAYTAVLTGQDELLRPVFDELVRMELLAIDDEVYVMTDKGKIVVEQFLEREQNFNSLFGVYSAIDLETGEFAWEGDLEDIRSDRWNDLRLAVAEAKGMDLVECSFFVFLATDTVCIDEGQWQAKFVAPKTWTEVEDYCNTAIMLKDLDIEEGDTKIPGAETIGHIIKFGAQINMADHKSLPVSESDIDEKFGLIGPKALDAKTLKNSLKPSYVAPCWQTDICTGKVLKAPSGYYW